MKPRQKRFVFIVVAVAALALVVGLVLNALNKNVSLYFTPTQVFNNEAPHGRSFRIGGKVEDDGVMHADEVLAKHDENYMPPEAADALKKAETANASAVAATPASAPVAK